MQLSEFRKRLIEGRVHLANRELLINEYQHFNSITPASPFEGVSDKFKEIFGDIRGGKTVLIVLLAIVFLPLLPMAIVVFAIIVLTTNRSPEWKGYDYKHKIAEPTLKLFDDKLEMTYHLDSKDLTDSGIGYTDALIEARLLRPLRKNHLDRILSSCSYDWYNSSNPDSFEFEGRKFYYEWKDDEGDTHEEIMFNGGIYKFHTNFTINGIINIMSTTTKKTLLSGEKETSVFKYIQNKDELVIDTENKEFSEVFDTIATYDYEAYQYLTPTKIEQLIQLRRKYFLSIFIKGNVMTVTIDNGGYNSASASSISFVKPSFRSKNPVNDLDGRVEGYRKALLSIYELKDILIG
ncbi:MAG: DUF3137 domain-containing protein [Eubacterium sp.]|nr:DUF3137 domain-containing protein [Eubacterium sp.]